MRNLQSKKSESIKTKIKTNRKIKIEKKNERNKIDEIEKIKRS